jgi:hypothetical protein
VNQLCEQIEQSRWRRGARPIVPVGFTGPDGTRFCHAVSPFSSLLFSRISVHSWFEKNCSCMLSLKETQFLLMRQSLLLFSYSSRCPTRGKNHKKYHFLDNLG